MNIAPDWMEDLPQDIDGMKSYKIMYICLEN